MLHSLYSLYRVHSLYSMYPLKNVRTGSVCGSSHKRSWRVPMLRNVLAGAEYLFSHKIFLTYIALLMSVLTCEVYEDLYWAFMTYTYAEECTRGKKYVDLLTKRSSRTSETFHEECSHRHCIYRSLLERSGLVHLCKEVYSQAKYVDLLIEGSWRIHLCWRMYSQAKL